MAAKKLLKAKLEGMGVTVRCGAAATTILGENGAVTGVAFKDGSTLDTDMVVISCGIRPNVEEAKAAGLAVERAIVVDYQMLTSDPSITAEPANVCDDAGVDFVEEDGGDDG